MKKITFSFASAAFAAMLFTACGSQPEVQTLKSGLDPAAFDTTINEKPVKLYTLTNANGMEVCITNYGGRVVSLVVPDKDGNFQDVVLGFDNIHQYADTLNSPARPARSAVRPLSSGVGQSEFVKNRTSCVCA